MSSEKTQTNSKPFFTKPKPFSISDIIPVKILGEVLKSETNTKTVVGGVIGGGVVVVLVVLLAALRSTINTNTNSKNILSNNNVNL